MFLIHALIILLYVTQIYNNLFNTQSFFYFISLSTLKRWATVDKKH